MTLSIQLCQGIWVVLSLLLLQTLLAESGLSVRSPGAHVLSFSWVLGVGVGVRRPGIFPWKITSLSTPQQGGFSLSVLQNGGTDSSPQTELTTTVRSHRTLQRIHCCLHHRFTKSKKGTLRSYHYAHFAEEETIADACGIIQNRPGVNRSQPPAPAPSESKAHTMFTGDRFLPLVHCQ